MKARLWITEGKALTLLLILWAPCAAHTMAATDARCTETLELALVDKNPDTRKQAVIALSLVGTLEPFSPISRGWYTTPTLKCASRPSPASGK